MRHLARAGTGFTLLFFLAACHEGGIEPETGSLEVSLSMAGTDLDSSGVAC